MKKTATRERDQAFVRIAPAARDRLRKFCTGRGLIMSVLVSNLVNEYIDGANGGGKPKARRAKPKK